MLDERIVVLARRTAATQIADLDGPFDMTIAGWKNKLRGYGQLFAYLMQAYEEEVERRAQVIWSNLHRAHGSLGSSVTPELRADLSVVLREDINAMVEALHPRFDVDMKDAPQSAKRPTWEAQLAAARDHEIARYDAEIEHYVASLDAAAARGAPAGASYVIHGNVGAVLTGQGAVANVVQNISNDQRETLFKALDLVKQVIGQAPEVEGRRRRELAEVADEAIGEVGKESPNTLRLSFALQTLAAAVQGIASGPGAYEALRAATAAIGIPL